MAKLLKTKRKKIKTLNPVPNADKKTPSVVLVGTYKENQLAFIEREGVYNYPIGENDKLKSEDAACVKELWLYADRTKTTRHVFEASFVGIQTREEFLAAHPKYPKGSKRKHTRYLVFTAKKVDYGPVIEDATRVFARASDFNGGKTRKIAAAIKQFEEGGEFGVIADYFPADLAQVPRNQLRVCEASVQMNFMEILMASIGVKVPFPARKDAKFTFIDLFAGIGGFHLAMHQLGGKCLFACEWDKDAQQTYEANYGILPAGDITKIDEHDIPKHDVLCAGFPCQAFSKAGKQLGFADETKGTLFFDVERILRYHKSKFIVLENVRNLVSHDNGNTWRTIYSHLVNLGYRTTPEPLIVSPHHFGIPQLRERVVVLGVYDPEHCQEPLDIELPKPKAKCECSLDSILEKNNKDPQYRLTKGEIEIIDTWDEFYQGIKEETVGFPIWLDWFKNPPTSDMPDWKKEFVLKNNKLYQNNKGFIDAWLVRHDDLRAFTPTMRKMEWQCGGSVKSAWDAFLQQRPSGLRIKRPDCAPALVAIVQVPIIGKYRRRMTLREAARLQSFDDEFIPCPNRHQAYKQFGNAVNVTVIRECAKRLFEYERAK